MTYILTTPFKEQSQTTTLRYKKYNSCFKVIKFIWSEETEKRIKPSTDVLYVFTDKYHIVPKLY